MVSLGFSSLTIPKCMHDAHGNNKLVFLLLICLLLVSFPGPQLNKEPRCVLEEKDYFSFRSIPRTLLSCLASLPLGPSTAPSRGGLYAVHGGSPFIAGDSLLCSTGCVTRCFID